MSVVHAAFWPALVSMIHVATVLACLCCHLEAVWSVVYVYGLSCHWKPCGSPCSVLPLAVMDEEASFAVEVMTVDLLTENERHGSLL